jgi:hypothetical protein
MSNKGPWREKVAKLSHFPIDIKIAETGEIITITSPDQVPSGKAFVVVATVSKS